jgi:hypothetical protein
MSLPKILNIKLGKHYHNAASSVTKGIQRVALIPKGQLSFGAEVYE